VVNRTDFLKSGTGLDARQDAFTLMRETGFPVKDFWHPENLEKKLTVLTLKKKLFENLLRRE
jgi:hypothetical protein